MIDGARFSTLQTPKDSYTCTIPPSAHLRPAGRPTPPPTSPQLPEKRGHCEGSLPPSGGGRKDTAPGHGGRNYPSSQRKIKCPKIVATWQAGPGQAAVTHPACQAATAACTHPVLTHSPARRTGRAEASGGEGGSISDSLNPWVTQWLLSLFKNHSLASSL